MRPYVKLLSPLVTFHVSRRRREMYIVTAVCVSVPRRIPTPPHGPGCKLANGRGCPLVVQCWADLQSVHGFRCYDNIAPDAKCHRVRVLALYQVLDGDKLPLSLCPITFLYCPISSLLLPHYIISFRPYTVPILIHLPMSFCTSLPSSPVFYS